MTLTPAAIANAMQCNRIEEVICHRFDQLNTAAQTVLKMAAVSSSNGSSFTFELLAFIINDENFGITKTEDSITSAIENAQQAVHVPHALMSILSHSGSDGGYGEGGCLFACLLGLIALLYY